MAFVFEDVAITEVDLACEETFKSLVALDGFELTLAAIIADLSGLLGRKFLVQFFHIGLLYFLFFSVIP